MVRWPQADRFAMARHFRPPGRLMFLRPVKGSRAESAARRAFEAVWIDAEVRARRACR